MRTRFDNGTEYYCHIYEGQEYWSPIAPKAGFTYTGETDDDPDGQMIRWACGHPNQILGTGTRKSFSELLMDTAKQWIDEEDAASPVAVN